MMGVIFLALAACTMVGSSIFFVDKNLQKKAISYEDFEILLKKGKYRYIPIRKHSNSLFVNGFDISYNKQNIIKIVVGFNKYNHLYFLEYWYVAKCNKDTRLTNIKREAIIELSKTYGQPYSNSEEINKWLKDIHNVSDKDIQRKVSWVSDWTITLEGLEKVTDKCYIVISYSYWPEEDQDNILK